MNLIQQVPFLLSWALFLGGVTLTDVLLAVLLSLQGALFSAWLEWHYPLRGWHVEADLWHHPRKYIAPAILLLLAVILIAFPSLWLLLAVALLRQLALF